MSEEYNKVYGLLVQDDTDILGLIAYGLYKNEKRQKILKYKTNNGGRNPTKMQVEKIADDLTDRLRYYQEKANQLLDVTVEELIVVKKDTLYASHFKSVEMTAIEQQFASINNNTKPKSLFAELKIEVLGNIAWLFIIIIITVMAYFMSNDVRILKQNVVRFIENTERADSIR